MQFTKIVSALALAAAVHAASNDTVVFTTIVVDSYTTVCPASSAITFNGVTYTNTLTESSTITITNCPCTVSAPVYTSSSVYCNTCAVPTSSPAAVVPVYSNATTPAVSPASSVAAATSAVVSVATTASPTATPSVITSSGASKAAFSGFSMAGLLAAAAYFL